MVMAPDGHGRMAESSAAARMGITEAFKTGRPHVKQEPSMKHRPLSAIFREWSTREGSQKGQYRLGHAEVGVLIRRIERLEGAIQSVIDDELDRVSPGVKQELEDALLTAGDTGAEHG